VDHERPSRGVVVAAVLVVLPKRLDEIRAIARVVVDERTQPLLDETSGLGLFPACQKSVDPEFVVCRDPSACLGRLPHPQSPSRLLVGTAEPRGLRCRSPDADRAWSRTKALRHGAVEVAPLVVRVPNGSRDDGRHFVMAACEQRARVQDGSDRTLDGLLESVATDSAADEQHVLWRGQVVAQGGRPRQRAVVVRSGQQVIDQVSPQPQFGFGQSADMGQLHPQYRRSLLEHHQLVLADAVFGVDDREYAQHVVTGLGKGDDTVTVTQRTIGRPRLVQHLVAAP